MKGCATIIACVFFTLGSATTAAKPPGKVRGKATAIRLNARDPQPLVTREYLDVAVRLDKGKLSVGKIRSGRLGRKQLIQRYRGRYQLRLYSHRLLLDIVRFDFPLTARAGERTPANVWLDRSIARGVRARSTVRVPYERRITRLVLLDAKRGTRVVVDLDKVGIRGPIIRPEVEGPKRTSVFK